MADSLDDDAPRTPEDWGEAFDEVRPTYLEFAERLSELLAHLLDDDEGVESFTYMIDKVHEVSRFVEMVYARGRDGEPVADPLAEFSDLARVTIVTPNKHDVAAICDLVEREFDVDLGASVDPAAAEARNADPAGHVGVGYDFPHFAVSLSESRRSLPEWQAYDGLLAQIDVQTELQRAWVGLYGLPAPGDRYLPAAYRAALVRAAELFRDADEQLLQVSHAWEACEEEARRAVQQSESDASLDWASLTAYLLGSDSVATLVRKAEEAGMEPDAYPEVVASIEDHLWVLRMAGIGTIGALDEFLRAAEPRAPAILASFTGLCTERDYVPTAAAEDIVSWLTLVLTRADTQTVALSRNWELIVSALNTVIGNHPDGVTSG